MSPKWKKSVVKRRLDDKLWAEMLARRLLNPDSIMAQTHIDLLIHKGGFGEADTSDAEKWILESAGEFGDATQSRVRSKNSGRQDGRGKQSEKADWVGGYHTIYVILLGIILVGRHKCVEGGCKLAKANCRKIIVRNDWSDSWRAGEIRHDIIQGLRHDHVMLNSRFTVWATDFQANLTIFRDLKSMFRQHPHWVD